MASSDGLFEADLVIIGSGSSAPGSPGARGYRYTFLHSDHLGTTRAATKEDGTVAFKSAAMPYGEILGSGPNRPKEFAGHARDEGNSLLYMMMRSYSPILGRFISRDRLAGTVLQPSSLNGYTYVDANPVAFTDPLGLSPMRPIIDTPYFALGGATSGRKKQDKDNQKAENKVKAFAALDSSFTSVDPTLLAGIETAIYFDPKFAASMAEMGAQLDAGHLLSFESKDVATLVAKGEVALSDPKDDPNTVSGTAYVKPNDSGGVTIHIVVNSNPAAGVSGPTLIAAAASHEVYHAVRMVRRHWKNPSQAERIAEEPNAHRAAWATMQGIFKGTGTAYPSLPDGAMKTTLSTWGSGVRP